MGQAENLTVVGIFDDYKTAERAVHDLMQAGIPRDSIEIKSNFMTGAAGRAAHPDETQEGGISGFFHRLFGGNDDEYAGHYAEAVRRGNAVVSVTAEPNMIDQAVEVMNQDGAIDIDRRVASFRQGGYERHDPNAPSYSLDEAAREREQYRNAETGTSIPVIKEELQVGKRVVRRGGVRIFSRVVEEPVEQSVDLREEHVRVERRPANRPVESRDTERMREQSVVVTEMAEVPVVQKRAHVREEVVVGKETTQRTEKVHETLRHTEVEVENIEAGGADSSADFRRDYESRYASTGVPYETLEPAYDYGYRIAGDPRYKGRNWTDVEEDLKTDYLRNQPNSSWDRVKGAVRYGWEKMTGKR